MIGQERSTNPTNFPSIFTTDIYTFYVIFSAGFAYFVTLRIGIIGSIGVLGYTNRRIQTTGLPIRVENNFGFDASTLGNRFTLGMYYTFRQGKAKE